MTDIDKIITFQWIMTEYSYYLYILYILNNKVVEKYLNNFLKLINFFNIDQTCIASNLYDQFFKIHSYTLKTFAAIAVNLQ